MVMSLRERRALRLSMDDLNERREGFPIAIGNQAAVVYPSVSCKPEEIPTELVDAGVYIIYARGVPVYVGTSANVRERLRHHPVIAGMTDALQCTVRLLFIDDPMERQTVEACIVGLWKPMANQMYCVRLYAG